ncbi:unnamed protein product [Phytophthora fragariaefolia]|uniref:Unnamed protein product n=1 Tax=Phytophthora fragariaefolia TaxID=1490495 RepID=A0A9W7CQB6_9STRA|nr:unnamed protein product [Phytophthora fragariaefolia]
MGDSFGSSKYILVLKDHVTHYWELVVADAADTSVTVAALLDWHSRFGIPPEWVSDNGSYFKNDVVAELSRRLRTKQSFKLAYSPDQWTSGESQSRYPTGYSSDAAILQGPLQGLGVSSPDGPGEPKAHGGAVIGEPFADRTIHWAADADAATGVLSAGNDGVADRS